MTLKISIGVPVFNGEKFIQHGLDSILSQTHTDFELIISDNASTDSTLAICEEYAKKDKRIQIIKQEKNIGFRENFMFVLNKAKNEYFVWLAADDWWEPTFLEKNISVLNSNKKFVGSVSKIDYYDVDRENKKKENILKSKIKRYRSSDEYFDCVTYQDRVSFYLRSRRAENIYGVFRTSIFKKCIQKFWKKDSVGMDIKILLFIQRFGEINLLNDTLLHRSGKGSSSEYSGKSNFAGVNDYGIIGKIFPFLSFSVWIFKNLGIRIFINNLDFLLLLNGSGSKYQLKHFFKKH